MDVDAGADIYAFRGVAVELFEEESVLVGRFPHLSGSWSASTIQSIRLSAAKANVAQFGARQIR